MLNAVTNSTVPHLTLIIGSSYGAGTYGMSGRAFNNRFTFLWPTAKIAVMGPKQIAGVMSQVRRGQAERKGEAFDEDEDAKIVAMVEEAQEKGSLALAATERRQRRRHHRPARHAHRARPLPLGRAQPTRRGRDELRGLPAVTFTTVARREPRRDRSAHHPRRPERRACARVAVYVAADADAPFVADADVAVLLTTAYLDARRSSIAAALSRAPTRSIRATAFSPRSAAFAAAVSSGRASRGSDRRRGSSPRWATSSRRRSWPWRRGLPVLPSSDDPAGRGVGRLSPHGQGRRRAAAARACASWRSRRISMTR